MSTPVTPPPPPAYPNPVHLPTAPQGNPIAATLLAAAYRTLADHLDHTTTHLSTLTHDLTTRWGVRWRLSRAP